MGMDNMDLVVGVGMDMNYNHLEPQPIPFHHIRDRDFLDISQNRDKLDMFVRVLSYISPLPKIYVFGL